MNTTTATETMTAYAIGTRVERITRFVGPEPVGEIIEMDASRVRVLWPPTPCQSAPRRSWLARNAFGKRWKVAV